MWITMNARKIGISTLIDFLHAAQVEHEQQPDHGDPDRHLQLVPAGGSRLKIASAPAAIEIAMVST